MGAPSKALAYIELDDYLVLENASRYERVRFARLSVENRGGLDLFAVDAGSSDPTRLAGPTLHGLIMETVNIHEAEINLSQLVDRAARGEPFLIAKAGKALVKVTAVDVAGAAHGGRTGFLAGQIAVPDDFDRMGGADIEHLFGGGAA